VLYGKEKWLEQMPPYQSGGGMIARVSFDETTYADLPHKFEAGTGNIVAAVSLATAMEYLNRIGLERISTHERELLKYAVARLREIDKTTTFGNGIERAGVISFNLDRIHPFDAGAILDKLGIAVRTGMHCAEPVMRRFSVPGMIRASFAVYNTKAEVDALIQGLRRVQSMMSLSLQ
jgi:cysteine desulfurase/selenocysteine lyase